MARRALAAALVTIGALGAATIAAAGTGSVQAVTSAEIRCRVVDGGPAGPVGDELRVKLVDEGHVAIVRRPSGRIVVATRAESGPLLPVDCAGEPASVTTIDLVLILVKADLRAVEIEFDQRGGLLAPGATDEAPGAPEIESRLQTFGNAPPSLAFVSIAGTSGPDRMRLGRANGEVGVNVNVGEADPDADIWISKDFFAFTVMTGGRGDDLLTARRAAELPQRLRLFLPALLLGGKGADRINMASTGSGFFPGGISGLIATGGPGRDFIRGSATAEVMHGGDGDDRIRAFAGSDIAIGGRGRDRISAGKGNDSVSAADRRRDVIRCGPGRDRVSADRRDRTRGCEERSRFNPFGA